MADLRLSGMGGIPFGENDGRPANPNPGQPYFNGEERRLELYTTSGWQNIVSETPGVVSISGNYIESTNSVDLDITGTNFTTGAIASVIGTNGVEVQAGSTTVNSIVSVTATFSNLSAAYEPYDVKVTNTSNLFGILPDALYINEMPSWTTSAGNLGTFAGGASVSLQLASTDPESNSLTYTLVSGSLPTGLSLSSAGLISGTNGAVGGTYSFVVSVSDGSNTAVNRTFNIISSGPTITGGTLTSDSTYYYREFTSNGNFVVSGAPLTADILSYAGGGAGGSQHGGGGGGAGGYVYSQGQSLSIATYSVVVGGGGAASSRSNGNNSRFGTLTEAIGGGAGATEGQDSSVSAKVGGSGGGGGGTYPATYMAGAAGTTGQGNAGGSGVQTSNYSGGAGGGGAGSAGSNNAGQSPGAGQGGNGGSGLNTWSAWGSIGSLGTSGYICGGGGGGAWGTTTSLRGLGTGGGGNGALDGEGTASSGISGSGGGGGGSSGAGSGGTRSGGSGGSGRVIVRYTRTQVGG